MTEFQRLMLSLSKHEDRSIMPPLRDAILAMIA